MAARIDRAVYRKGPVAREEQGYTYVSRRLTREEDYAPVRAEFSQAFLRAQRETIRACARAGLPEREEEVGEEEEEADHVCTRAPGAQVIRAISSKFRGNEISRVVVSVPARLVHKPAERLHTCALLGRTEPP